MSISSSSSSSWPEWSGATLLDCCMQLAPAAIQNRQQHQHSSETAPEEAVADRHDSSDPPGEAAAEAGASAVTDSDGAQPAVTVDRLPVLLAGAPTDGRQAAALLQPAQHVVSKLAAKAGSLKRSVSLPSGLATLPAAAAGISLPEDLVPPGKPNPDSSLAQSNGELGSLGQAQGQNAKGSLGTVDSISSLGVCKGSLQLAHSLPLVHAAVPVAAAVPTAASASASAAAAAAAAADSVLHHSLRHSAASNLSRSAFKPYNGNSLNLSAQGTTTAGNNSSQNRLSHVSGSAASKHDHMGANNQGSSCKALIADDKENLLPAETRDNRPTPHASKGPASMIDTGSIKISSAVYTSAVGSAKQSVGGLSSADGHDSAGEAYQGSYNGMREASVGAQHTQLGHSGAESAGNISASKRAKFTHGVD